MNEKTFPKLLRGFSAFSWKGPTFTALADFQIQISPLLGYFQAFGLFVVNFAHNIYIYFNFLSKRLFRYNILFNQFVLDFYLI